MVLQDKVAIVTGAGSGLGRSFAQALTADGAYVVLAGRTKETLEETAAMCAADRSQVVVTDTTVPADVHNLVEQTVRSKGHLDFLLTCAGVNPQGEWPAISHEEWATAIQVNLLGVELCCREAMPVMRKNNFGRIVNLGSRTASAAPAGWSAYAVSKAALSALTRMLALEIDAAEDIQINDLIPGITRSKMSPGGQDPAEVYPYLRQLLQQPAGSPHGLAWQKGRPVNIWLPPQQNKPKPGLLRRIKRRLTR